MITRLALTPGDPAGIGPDIVISLAQKRSAADVLVFADPAMLEARARQLGLPLTLITCSPDDEPALLPAGALHIHPVLLDHHVQAGVPHPATAPYILKTLRLAVDACLHQQCDAMITGPVNKGLIHQAGYPFTGHTEYLTQLTHSNHAVMMLATQGLRVALVTTHLPLRDVPSAITAELLEKTLRILHLDLCRYFCTDPPEIFVCGLNPHAGDAGALGQEEIEVLIPVINKLREEGMRLTGPFSADTIFSPDNLAKADVFLAMYHDQGLPVLKYRGFSNAINITLGLNIIRTSVDHGTAYSLAGTGRADDHSLQLAIDTALHMVQSHRRGRLSP